MKLVWLVAIPRVQAFDFHPSPSLTLVQGFTFCLSGYIKFISNISNRLDYFFVKRLRFWGCFPSSWLSLHCNIEQGKFPFYYYLFISEYIKNLSLLYFIFKLKSLLKLVCREREGVFEN